MRILNRPMFRYGGPIKEGVMHGMRNGGRAALIGNPLYPQTDGREHHKVNLSWFKPKGLTGTTVAQKPSVIGSVLKNIYNKYKFPPKYQYKGQLYKEPFKGRLGPVSAMERAGSYVRKHPVLTGGGALLGVQSDPVKGIAKGAWNLIPEVAQFGAEALMPKEGYGPFKEK